MAPGMAMTPGVQARRKKRTATASPRPDLRLVPPPSGDPVVRWTPDRLLHHVAKRFLVEPPPRCGKCGSTFVGREPAFVHCFYCGTMARIANASLLEQELFEVRSGLRLAS